MKITFYTARLHFAKIGGILWMAGDILTAIKKYLEKQLYVVPQATDLDTIAGVLFIVSSIVLIMRGHRHNGIIVGRSFSFLGLLCLIISSGFSMAAIVSTISLIGMELSCTASIIEAFRDEKRQRNNHQGFKFPQLIPMLPGLICNSGYLAGALLKHSLPETGVGILWVTGTLCMALSRQEIKQIS